MKKVKNSGRTIYDAPLGILMLETHFPRIPGDIGNASSFNFPVVYKVVKGANADRVVSQGDPALVEEFISAGKELVASGTRALVASCGFLALFQKEISEALPVPCVASSLVQLPMVHCITGGKPVGVITANSSALTHRHFLGVGAAGIPVVVEGIENSPFGQTLLRDLPEFDYEEAETAVIGAAKRLLESNRTIGAIVLECTNLPPFSEAIRRATNLPVFDIVTLTRMLFSTLGKDFYLDNFES